jgi:sec-independent protein translocase protein TatA
MRSDPPPMPNIGPVELIIILVIALIVIGPGRLPDVGAALGKSIREFRKASSDITDAARVDTSPLPPATPPAPATSVTTAPVAPAPTIAAPVAPAPTATAPVTTPSSPDDEAAAPPA